MLDGLAGLAALSLAGDDDGTHAERFEVPVDRGLAVSSVRRGALRDPTEPLGDALDRRGESATEARHVATRWPCGRLPGTSNTMCTARSRTSSNEPRAAHEYLGPLIMRPGAAEEGDQTLQVVGHAEVAAFTGPVDTW